jgi:hypothetical protein
MSSSQYWFVWLSEKKPASIQHYMNPINTHS